MLKLISPTYGEVTLPFTESQSEQYAANVPMYARDNTANNVRDSVGTGAIIKPASFKFNSILSNNDGGILPKYDIAQSRQTLLNIYHNSELITLVFGLSNSFAFFADQPIIIDNVVIQELQIDADQSTGSSYNVSLTLVEQILVSSIYNPEVINVPPGVGDRIKKALSPQNNGTVSAGSASSGAVSNDWNDLKQSLGQFF